MKVRITIEADLNAEQAECFKTQANGLVAVADELAQAETVKDILRNPTDSNVKLSWKTIRSIGEFFRNGGSIKIA
jgi:mannose/fructose/N-acetylgalactosamine-specific phosphotransferase system component IIB